MASFISHFKNRTPRLAAGLVLLALGAWAGSAVYSTRYNPQTRFFVEQARLQDRWTRKMEREHGRKVIVTGGSSTMFSIIGEQMLGQHGLPTVNMGLSAGMGAQVIVCRVLPELRAGDTLVVAIEPDLLTGSLEPTMMAVQFSYAMGHPEWVTSPALDGVPLAKGSAMLALRPDAHHVFTFAGKILSRRLLYRYQISETAPSGWSHTTVRFLLNSSNRQTDDLSADGRQFLHSLRRWCDEHQIRVVYSLPWKYSSKPAEEAFRRNNVQTLLQINEIIPVLKDPVLGTDTDPAHFADTGWHLNKEGSRLRTESLGRELTEWRVWQAGELRRILAETPSPKP